jgi:D-lactate dehydratase
VSWRVCQTKYNTRAERKGRSAAAPLHGTHTTGAFISEALHPFQVFKAAGFEVDFVSEKGTYTADWLSLQDDFLPAEDRKVYEDLDSEFRYKMDHMPPVDSVDGKKVCSVAGPAVQH